MSGDIGIGELITLDAVKYRDAIHVAVIPVVATEKLAPGEHVSITANGQAIGVAIGDGIAIIDPFLRAAVKTGQRCFAFLYPGSITSLRHEWTHPAFGEVVMPSEKVDTPKKVDERDPNGTHRQFFEGVADRMGVDYDELMEHAADHAASGDYWTEGGRFEGMGIYDIEEEFWLHWEAMTGKTPKHTGNFFSCSC